jgi:Ni,Fe-hydrogenase I cytochrome b subunit
MHKVIRVVIWSVIVFVTVSVTVTIFTAIVAGEDNDC